MCELSENEIRFNAALLAERDRLRERESALLKANNETEEKRRETARQLAVANTTIHALQEVLHSREETIYILRNQIHAQSYLS